MFIRKLFIFKYPLAGITKNAKYSFSTSSSMLKYFTQKHEWVDVDNTTGTIGISDYAQESLGDVVFVQLPEIGSDVTNGVECGALESVKAATELYSPVSGKVTEINTKLETKPELVNKSCYTEGWLFKVHLNNIEELDNLLSEEEYKKFLKTDSETEH